MAAAAMQGQARRCNAAASVPEKGWNSVTWRSAALKAPAFFPWLLSEDTTVAEVPLRCSAPGLGLGRAVGSLPSSALGESSCSAGDLPPAFSLQCSCLAERCQQAAALGWWCFLQVKLQQVAVGAEVPSALP